MLYNNSMSMEMIRPPVRLGPEELLAELIGEFDRLNHAHFGGVLVAPVVVLSRRKTFGGYYQPQRHRIVLSLQAYHEHGWDETLNTFRHEVAHIAHPDHSKAFWALAAELGATKRYAAAPLRPKPRRSSRYIYACAACGSRITRLRRLRKPSSCGVCDKRYNPRFALRLIAQEPCHSFDVFNDVP